MGIVGAGTGVRRNIVGRSFERGCELEVGANQRFHR